MATQRTKNPSSTSDIYCITFLLDIKRNKDYTGIIQQSKRRHILPLLEILCLMSLLMQSLCNPTFLLRFCVVALLLGFFCGFGVFCHSTESDLFLFLFVYMKEKENNKLVLYNMVKGDTPFFLLQIRCLKCFIGYKTEREKDYAVIIKQSKCETSFLFCK